MPNKAERIIERLFHDKYVTGATSVAFDVHDIHATADALGERRPGNPWGVVYELRYNKPMPASVEALAPAGATWVIRGTPGGYSFDVEFEPWFVPDATVPVVDFPDNSPALIRRHQLDDEQGVLARARHSSLIQAATGLVAYSLQTHVRTNVAGIGQVEIDEVYVGVDRLGVEHVIPIEAKRAGGNISKVQMEQALAFGVSRFPNLQCLPVGLHQTGEHDFRIFIFESVNPSTWAGANSLKLDSELAYRLIGDV